jgi:hypothetical protein
LSACIYDNGFLRIEPTPKPNIPNRTVGRQMDPVRTPAPNVNPGQKPFRERYPENRQADSKLSSPDNAPALPRGEINPNNGNNGTTGNTAVKPERSVRDNPKPAIETSTPATTVDGGVRTPRPVYSSGTSKPVEVNNPVSQPNSGTSTPVSTSGETVRPVKVESVPERNPEITRPVISRPVMTEPVRTEPTYTPPARTISTPIQRPVSTPAPVSVPSSTPAKTISTPIRRGG